MGGCDNPSYQMYSHLVLLESSGLAMGDCLTPGMNGESRSRTRLVLVEG